MESAIEPPHSKAPLPSVATRNVQSPDPAARGGELHSRIFQTMLLRICLDSLETSEQMFSYFCRWKWKSRRFKEICLTSLSVLPLTRSKFFSDLAKLRVISLRWHGRCTTPFGRRAVASFEH
jgi:hypothetical protein